jgi:nitrogen fixation/metabolism regulation signal transduction histidine kinase
VHRFIEDLKNMDFSDLKVSVAVRVIALTITLFILALLIGREGSGLSFALIFIISVIQVVALVNFISKYNELAINVLQTLREENLAELPDPEDRQNIEVLSEEFDKAIDRFRKMRAEKDEQYHYLKTIVQHVGIGIITFNQEGEIQIMNSASRKLLGTSQVGNIAQLMPVSTELVNAFKVLKTGGRQLVKLESEGNVSQLSVSAIELTLQDEMFKLVSIQNIQSELEEKEMEAWQNLIRVLTHEIMNSVTPISSLASTVESDLESYLRNGNYTNAITDAEVEDFHLAIQTIHRRSDGLIRFVSDFRNLARIPEPKIDNYKAKEIFDQINTLLKFEFEKNQVSLKTSIDPADLELLIDKELMEQVLINLIKNALQALIGDDRSREKHVELIAQMNGNAGPEIIVRDNGPGIEEEALSKIFIPFFTTKKTGSGIGLSLSKQIIRKHNANISVSSTINEGTEFTIRF